MFGEAEFWVGVALILFFVILVYLKVPAMITGALDERASKISSELDEARKLREDAQALLSQYERKRKDAEKEAEDIVALARREAELFATESRQKMATQMERRTRLAEQKIDQAEAQALKEVRSTAADIAVAAAGSLIAKQVKGSKAALLVDESIAALKTRLN